MRPARFVGVLLLLASVTPARAQEDEPWLGAAGVTGYEWGTSNVPFDAVPRTRDYVLPDSSYIGANKQDRPDDLEVKGPTGERRFLRYARGALVDAWWVKAGKLDPEPLTMGQKAEWTGVVLGPAEQGFLAYGTASSWTIGDRTVLYWKDREGKAEILVSRAAPTLQYGIGRAHPLEVPGDTKARPRLSGDFKKEAKDYVGPLGSCFDTSPKPVGATIELVFDAKGLPSRIKVAADQPAFNLEDCVAAALMEVRAAPNARGTLEMLRFQ